MRRTLSMLIGLCLVVAGGCGDDPDATTAATDRIAPWTVESPYLPPPDPVRLGRRGGSAAAPETTAEAPAEDEDSDALPSGAQSDAEVAAELAEAYGKGGGDVDRATIDGAGLATIPPTAPRKLVALMQAANAVAKKPYVYGGGHGRNPKEIWEDSAYDCSGSISYALAAAGYIKGPEVSGTLAKFGKPGPGKWVTIFANEGHAFMVVAGLRFDTSGRQRTGTRWQAAARGYSGFTVRHPPGL